jgi:hypothetical protein
VHAATSTGLIRELTHLCDRVFDDSFLTKKIIFNIYKVILKLLYPEILIKNINIHIFYKYKEIT